MVDSNYWETRLFVSVNCVKFKLSNNFLFHIFLKNDTILHFKKLAVKMYTHIL